MKKTASIIATFQAREGSEKQLAALLSALVAETAREAGAISYDLSIPEGKPRTLVVTEHYASIEARKAHLSSAHLAKAAATWGTLIEGTPDVVLLDTIASARGHA